MRLLTNVLRGRYELSSEGIGLSRGKGETTFRADGYHHGPGHCDHLMGCGEFLEPNKDGRAPWDLVSVHLHDPTNGSRWSEQGKICTACGDTWEALLAELQALAGGDPVLQLRCAREAVARFHPVGTEEHREWTRALAAVDALIDRRAS